ncbi:phosphoribosylanthranilate isomerase [Nocardia thailandica]
MSAPECSRVRVKFCGLRSESDVRTALRAGADAIGFICGQTHFTEDALDEAAAEKLVHLAKSLVQNPRELLGQDRSAEHRVRGAVSTVLVTHLQEADDIVRLAGRLGVDEIQVHGLIGPDVLAEVVHATAGWAHRPAVVRAVHVMDESAIDDAVAASDTADAIVLDTRTADRLGGTGLVHDWTISKQIVEKLAGCRTEVYLAGGLTPANVADAVALVGPDGVDVNSGVDDAHGDKAPSACDAFANAVRAQLVSCS